MDSDAEIREEIAAEREQLTEAVGALRDELDHAAEQGKRVGIAVGALTGAAIVLRAVLRRRRRS
jgi:hypothetical protein